VSIAGIFSNHMMNQSAASVQNQQRTAQAFQQMAQELESGNLSGTQAISLQGNAVQASTAAQPAASVQSDVRNNHVHWHRHMHVHAGGESSGQATNTTSASQTGETAQAGITTTAQNSYTNWQQDFQQVALNSDLLKAQSATLESSGLSVMV